MGPGQRVGYVDDRSEAARTGRPRRYVATLEEWMISHAWLAFNVRGERREDRIGVWVQAAGQRARALRTRSPRYRHADEEMDDAARSSPLNVEPDLSHFDGIVPGAASATRAMA